MGALDQVIQLKKQGVSEKDIIKNLTQQGLNPKDIDMALQQANIKNAVSQSIDNTENQTYTGIGDTNFNEMQPSLLDSLQNGQPEQERGEPYPEEVPTQQQGYYTPQTQQYAPQQIQYLPEQEQQYEEYAPQTGLDSETITEIAEQVVQDKTNELKSNLDDLKEFRSLMQTKVDYIDNRLQRMEQLIDKLQMSILEKVGSYLTSTENIKKEMSMMQDSFSKVISNKENLQKLKEIAEEKTPTIKHQSPTHSMPKSPNKSKTNSKKSKKK